MDAIGIDGPNLVVANAQPAGAGAYQEAVDTNGVNERDQRGIAERTNEPALQVIDLHAQQFGKVYDFFRHDAIARARCLILTRAMKIRPVL